MPMRKGTRYFITWKYRQVMIMAQKKDRSRFTIKFRESDPAHDMTIRILEKQGQRNITPFLVNAVLHYVHCSETPDVSHMLTDNSTSMVDRNAIEDIVWGILLHQGIVKEELTTKLQTNCFDEIKEELNKKEMMSTDSIEPQLIIKDDIRAMISRTLSSFRSE